MSCNRPFGTLKIGFRKKSLKGGSNINSLKDELPFDIHRLIYNGIDFRIKELKKALKENESSPQFMKLTRVEVIQELEVIKSGMKFGEENQLFTTKNLKTKVESIKIPEKIETREDLYVYETA